jgi:hypothetical protein
MHWSGQGEGRFPWHRSQNETSNTETGLIVQRSIGVTKQGRLQNIGIQTLTQPLPYVVLHHEHVAKAYQESSHDKHSTLRETFNSPYMANVACFSILSASVQSSSTVCLG